MARTSKVVPFGKSQYGPLQLQRKTFRIIGYYPGDSGFLHWAMVGVFVFHYWFQIQLSYWEIRYGWLMMREGDVLAALEGICPTPSRIDAILKCLILIGERKKLKMLLDKLVELHDQGKASEKSIYQWANYWGHQFTKFELTFFIMTCIFFCLLPMATMIYHAVVAPDEPRIYLLPALVALPYNYAYSPAFEFTFLLLAFITFTPSFMLAGGDGLFIGVCLLVTSQFRIVQQQLESLSREEAHGTAVDLANPTAAENDRVLAQLKLIAQRHNQAIEISREMSSLFMPNVFAVYTIAAVKIGLACLILMQSEGFKKLIYMFGSLGILTEIYVYSYGGTLLLEESEQIRRSAYDFPWYRYDKDVRRLIQMMMIRARKPSGLDVPFFEASVATFGMIIRTAGSWVTLMQTFL
ncbi:odorant receptor 10a-like [Culex pipiens pallens]|uniref:odorant receptor 10a-like n=1 Tax=Culex pipiens pallens TaxID=42434 RepID=UPI001952CED3|nr:odorant receptor 10a-like [Culex pipiens pallens]